MKFKPTKHFWSGYARLPTAVKQRAQQAFQLFQQGPQRPPFHPSLRIRKMQGYRDVWEGHITMQYVFTFHIEQDPDTGEPVYIFRKVGTHNIYRNP